MTVHVFEESAAAQAVGTNLSSGKRGQSDTGFRILRRIAVVGSAVAGDAAVEVFFGDTFVGQFFNTTAAVKVASPETDWVTLPGDIVLEAGELLNVLIKDAGATNVLVVHADLIRVG